MAGPWEDYSSTTTNPWEDYSKTDQNQQVAQGVKTTLGDERPGWLQILRGVSEAVSKPTDYIRPMVLPTVGGLIGGVAGAASPVPGGMLLGEAGGSALGEYGNQKLGITEPSTGQIALAGVAPGATRLGMGTLKGAALAIGKTFGGKELIADVTSTAMQRLFSPGTPSAKLYDIAKNTGVSIDSTGTKSAIDTALTSEITMADTPIKKAIVDILEPLQKTYGQGQRIPASQLIEESQRLSELAQKSYNSGATKIANVISQVRSAMINDMEPVFKEASKAYRKEQAVKELGSIVRSAKPVNTFNEAVSSDTLFSGAFSDAEKQEIGRILAKLSGTTASGFSGIMGRTITAVAGGEAAGLPGAIAGSFASDMVSGALGTKPGRALLDRLITSPGGFNYPKMAVLAQFLRAQSAEPSKADFNAIMKNRELSLGEKIGAAMKRAQAKQITSEMLQAK